MVPTPLEYQRKVLVKKKVDPKIYGLPPRTDLYQDGAETFIISINRKSRIVMKDALTVLEKAQKIKNTSENAIIFLETNAPVCSKSTKFLTENGIEIIGAST